MDVVNAEQARIAEDAGAVAVMVCLPNGCHYKVRLPKYC
jgi:pyridoxal biosynthesis lyase PdxS